MMLTMVAGPFRASGVNLTANDFVAGLPSPSAFLGFVGALNRFAGVDVWSPKVLPVIHSVTVSEGRKKANPGLFPNSIRSIDNGRNGRVKNVDIPEMITGSLDFTVVALVDPEFHVRDATNGVGRLRLAGGSIFPIRPDHSKITVFNEVLDFGSTSFRKIVPRGWAMMTHGLDDESDAADNGVGMVSCGDAYGLSRIKDRYGVRETGAGIVRPTACGYRLLEKPDGFRYRAVSRGQGKYQHVFAEPVVGMARFESIRRSDLSETVESRMWKWSCDFDHGFHMFSDFHLDAMKRRYVNGS